MNKIENNNNDEISQEYTSNSDNPTDDNKMEKKSRNRACKSERYTEEREEIIKELNTITGLDKDNRVILYDLEHNEKLINKLKEKIPEIRRLFKTGNWGYFSKDELKGMGNEIGLLKAIYKNEGYDITSKRKICEREGIKKLHIELHFNKNY